MLSGSAATNHMIQSGGLRHTQLYVSRQYVVVHKIPMTWTVYLVIYVQILGKSFGKFIWDFIGNFALILINVWSSGLILECQSRREISPQ